MWTPRDRRPSRTRPLARWLCLALLAPWPVGCSTPQPAADAAVTDTGQHGTVDSTVDSTVVDAGPAVDIPGADAPDVPSKDAADVPTVVDTPATPDVTDATDATDATGVTDVPDVPGTSDAGAGPLTFTSLGPTFASNRSGKINAVAFHPTDPRTLLIAGGLDGTPSSCGIFRTTDGGATWLPAVTGLTGTDGLTVGTVNALWINPTAPMEVFAGTAYDGTYRSTDGGQTWTRVDTRTAVARFAYANGTLYAATSVGVLAWNPAGGAWTVAQATATPVDTLAAQGSTVLAGTHAGDVYQLAGAVWSRLGRAPAAIHRFAIHPTSPRTVYAAVEGGSYNYTLVVSTDGGATWPTTVAWPSNILGVQDIAFSTVTPGRLYVVGDGRLIWTRGDASASPVYTQGAVGLDVRALYVMANSAGTDDRCVVASDQGLAVAERCSVAGSTVTSLGHGLSTSLLTDFAVSPDGQSLVAMLQDFSAYASADGGATWTAVPANEDGYAAVNPGMPALCYAFRQAFYRSMDGCRTFARTGTFASSVATTASNFAFDPVDPQTFYVVSETPPGIQRTTTGGQSFTAVTWPFTHPTAVAVAPGNRQHILVGQGTAVSVSTDGGTHWTASTGLPASGALTVAISPRSESIVLASVFAANTVTAYRSTDGGMTFTLAATVVPSSAWISAGGIAFGGVVYSPGVTAPVAVITSRNGAFLSRDDGVHWARIDTTTTTHRFTAAHVAGGYLYLSTYGQGILRSTTPVE